MSNSTISTVNKYLLSSNAPSVPVLQFKEANVTWPTSYNNLSSYFAGLTSANRRLVVTMPASQINAWRQKSGHEIIVSSYLKAGTPVYMSYDMFDEDNGTTFWGASWTAVDGQNFYDSTNMGNFAQSSYNSSGAYIGGGVNSLSINNFFTTTFTGGTGSANGEWIDFIFPYSVKLNNIQILCRNNLVTSAPKTIILLGSNDNGSSWTFINSFALGTYAITVWNTTTITTSEKYSRVRIIVTETRQNALNIGGLRLNYDIYDF